MKTRDISGAGVALITPFNTDESIDFDSLGKIIESQIENNIDFFVVMGTTGETSLLSFDEKVRLMKFVKDKVAGRKPLVLGYGGISTAEMIENFKEFDFSGYDALLVVTPFYVKPSQEGLKQHYLHLADKAPLPIILYNVPGRTGINMEPETTLSLALHPNIMGIKEASGKLFQIEELIINKPKDFKLYSGDDALTFHLVNVGADGVISVVANALPAEVATVVHNAATERVILAADTHNRLRPITKAIFIEGNPCGVKYLMSIMGKCQNVLRLPLVPVSEKLGHEIDNHYKVLND